MLWGSPFRWQLPKYYLSWVKVPHVPVLVHLLLMFKGSFHPDSLKERLQLLKVGEKACGDVRLGAALRD